MHIYIYILYIYIYMYIKYIGIPVSEHPFIPRKLTEIDKKSNNIKLNGSN